MIKRLTATALAAAFALAPMAATADGHACSNDVWNKVMSRGKIVVGVKADYKPWGYRDSTGEIVGMEIDMAKDVADKTNWRKMLKNEYPEINIKEEKGHMLELMIDNLERDNHGQDFSYIYDNISDDEKEKIVNINYPVLEYPSKITSFNFDKNPIVEGTLQGIKGQYLLLDTGVINMRKFAGYLLETDF